MWAALTQRLTKQPLTLASLFPEDIILVAVAVVVVVLSTAKKEKPSPTGKEAVPAEQTITETENTGDLKRILNNHKRDNRRQQMIVRNGNNR